MKLIRSAKRPSADAVRQGKGSDQWLVHDDAPGLALGRDDVPQRFDLPKKHPLYGKRVLRVVESGQPSQVMMNDGKILPNGKTPPGLDHER